MAVASDIIAREFHARPAAPNGPSFTGASGMNRLIESRLRELAEPVTAADVVVGLDFVDDSDPAQAAAALFGACRPGGRILLAVPEPGSFIARVNAIAARHAGAGYTGFVGTRAGMDAVFGGMAVAQGARDNAVTFHAASAEHWLADWRSNYAPLREAYRRVATDADATGRRNALTNELLELAALFGERRRGKLCICSDYLEFIVHKGSIQ